MRAGKWTSRWFALAAVSAEFLMMVMPAQAQQGDLIAQRFLNNVVQLTTTFSNGKIENGFGFVIGERDNRLYVVTARHVVRNDDDPGVTTRQVQVRFKADRGKPFFAEPPLPLNLAYKDWEVALLEVRPFADYVWNYVWTPQCLAANPTRGERVWFIGRNGEWWIPPDLIAGVIEQDPIAGDEELSVQIDSVLPGTSGAPLFTANGIVGMIVSDSLEDVRVINIESIRQVVVRIWDYPWGLQPFAALPPAAPTSPPAPTAKPTAAPTPTPEPAPTHTPPATAVLTLRSNVHEDQVFVDGAYYGATRLDLELPLGRHAIRIEKAGYLPFEQTIDLQAAYMLKAVLEPQPTPTPTAKPTAAPPPTPEARSVWTEPQTGMEFVWIEGGCFQMGQTEAEKAQLIKDLGKENYEKYYQDELPRHEVCLDGFWMGQYEVTNAQYRKFKQDHDSQAYESHTLNGDDQPAVYVSWDDARAFTDWLTKQHQGKYAFRLPTEAEWEYACRAGTTTSRFWGDNPDDACGYANVGDLIAKQNFPNWDWKTWGVHDCQDGYAVTAPVGSFRPNPFGLHDMLGNVWEWCLDTYTDYSQTPRDGSFYGNLDDGKAKLLRGGSWGNNPNTLRCANRNDFTPALRGYDIGLRVVRGR